ncbi:hypothetical protein [Arthrobacter sp. ok909]|uniref:hypothetical protein n=1 Tax=Arthrobacter sp. ok909 TaxID=1761746 RepID=UPI00111453B1|nr:hypothetical protein [Arthrobacter sp. ok909]
MAPVTATPVVVTAKPMGPVPCISGVPPTVGRPLPATRAADNVGVGVVDAAAAGAAIAAAITGTLHAAPFTTARRSKLAFGAARLFVSDIFYPKF